MLIDLAVLFLIISLVSSVFGFTKLARESATIAKACFGIFLFLFLVTLCLLWLM